MQVWWTQWIAAGHGNQPGPLVRATTATEALDRVQALRPGALGWKVSLEGLPGTWVGRACQAST